MPHSPLTPLYTPDTRTREQSLLKQYMNWLFVKKGLYFRDYDDLWDWSVTDLEDFWESIWQFFDVQSHTPYLQVVMKPSQTDMIGTEWFAGATLNYAEHIFRHQNTQRPALLVASEIPRAGNHSHGLQTIASQQQLLSVSWQELEYQVAALAMYLRRQGVGVGDRVVAVLPNGPEAVVAFLATNAIGAVWSVCSPDFGTASIVDRFQQIEPKVLIAADGYSYNGKRIDKTEAIRELRINLPTLRRVIWIPYLDPDSKLERAVLWPEVLNTPAPDGLVFEPVPFNHPIWILYSSGTTGRPKAITHSVGGCLLEHLKVLALHQDVRMGETYFWYSTTGWMMWNFALGSLLVGATLVLYDGAAGYPDLNALWDLVDEGRINHFGGGAAYFLACGRAGLKPSETHRLTHLRTIGSTGSPLPPEGFRWIYESVKKNVWLISFSGGTDVCSGFVGGNPLLPVYEEEIQCRLLGCKVEAFDDQGQPVRGELGEMVILEPMPSMPIYFWNDADNARYRKSYFGTYPGIWRHGDYIRITERNGVIIHGRSDATLNRDGIRIGTSEIYSAVESLPEIADSLVVGLEQPGGRYFMPLFVVLTTGATLTDELVSRIKQTLRSQFSPRHVPDAVYVIDEVPYTISGKKLETPVKKMLSGMDATLATSRDVLRNPAALDQFASFTIEQ